ncbi:MAG: hypothetical protein ABW252_10665 [Polyangiales bacterium]
MQQAETIVTHRSAVLPVSACARLRQGSSARATFILEDAAGGTTITVGADATCDWQVRAAFVPPHAFSLRLREGQVTVQAGPAQGVLLNGKLLGEGWSPVPNGARIDVGLARVEVAVGIGAAHLEGPRGRIGFAAGAPSPRPVHALLDALPLDGVRAPVALPPLPPSAPEPVPPAVLLRDYPEESGEFEVYRRHRDSNPALLERREPADSGAMRRYAVLGVVTACAYGGWLALLDFL